MIFFFIFVKFCKSKIHVFKFITFLDVFSEIRDGKGHKLKSLDLALPIEPRAFTY